MNKNQLTPIRLPKMPKASRQSPAANSQSPTACFTNKIIFRLIFSLIIDKLFYIGHFEY